MNHWSAGMLMAWGLVMAPLSAAPAGSADSGKPATKGAPVVLQEDGYRAANFVVG